MISRLLVSPLRTVAACYASPSDSGLHVGNVSVGERVTITKIENGFGCIEKPFSHHWVPLRDKIGVTVLVSADGKPLSPSAQAIPQADDSISGDVLPSTAWFNDFVCLPMLRAVATICQHGDEGAFAPFLAQIARLIQHGTTRVRVLSMQLLGELTCIAEAICRHGMTHLCRAQRIITICQTLGSRRQTAVDCAC